MTSKRPYSTTILVLNWNNAKDTIDCLQSIFALNSKTFCIVICDNYSTDNSVADISSYLKRIGVDATIIEEDQVYKDLNQFVIIRNKRNYGYAGGNNRGLRYVINNNLSDYVWILNNDVIVDSDSMKYLELTCQNLSGQGICGSLTLYADNRRVVWANGGGIYNRFLAHSKCIDENLYLDNTSDIKEPGGIDFIAGSSFFMSVELLKDVGFFDERYFLYFEETDYCLRAKRKGYQLKVVPESIIYHKVGASTTSYISYFHSKKSALLFTKKFYPLYLPLVAIRIIFLILLTLVSQSMKYTRKLMKACIPLRYHLPLIYWWLYITQKIDPEIALLQKLDLETKIAIDIGANMGVYSFLLAKKFNRVLAFEPNVDASAKLRAYTALCPKITLYDLGLSNRTGKEILNVPLYKGLPNTGLGSMTNTFDSGESRVVNLCKLDDLQLDNVGFIKIDVEGHENDVLSGAELTIKRNMPILFIEIEQRHLKSLTVNDVIGRITKMGYQGFFVYDQKLCNISAFNSDRMQNYAMYRSRPTENSYGYINNFIFYPLIVPSAG